MADRRCALVTGASRGIGSAVSRRLAREGYAIAGCYTSPSEAAEKTEAAVRAEGADCLFAPCDIRDASAVEELISTTERELGEIDVVVNNAGVTADSPIALMKAEQWQSVVDTNLTGTWNVCRAATFRMMKRKRGAIVNMSSVAGVHGNPGQTNYAATKAGIIGLSKSLAKEVARYGIRVNVVAPGFIESDMTAALGPKARERALGMIPIGRLGTVDDVAAAVSYLVCDDAAYITGQVLQVDGGIVL